MLHLQEGRVERLLKEFTRHSLDPSLSIEANTISCLQLASHLFLLGGDTCVESMFLRQGSIQLPLREQLAIALLNTAGRVSGPTVHWMIIEVLVFLWTVHFGTVDDIVDYVLFQDQHGNPSSIVASTDPRFCTLKGRAVRQRAKSPNSLRSASKNRVSSIQRPKSSGSATQRLQAFKNQLAGSCRSSSPLRLPPERPARSPLQIENDDDEALDSETTLELSFAFVRQNLSTIYKTEQYGDRLPEIVARDNGRASPSRQTPQLSAADVDKHRHEWKLRTACRAVLASVKGSLIEEGDGIFFLSSEVVINALERTVLYSGRAKTDARARVLSYISWRGRDHPLYVKHALALQVSHEAEGTLVDPFFYFYLFIYLLLFFFGGDLSSIETKQTGRNARLGCVWRGIGLELFWRDG